MAKITTTINVEGLDLCKDMFDLLKEIVSDPDLPPKYKLAYEELREKYADEYLII